MAVRATKPEARSAVGRWGAREAGILDVAGRLYAARGYERVSMAHVALTAGLSEGTLYNYFRDKNDLVVSVGLAALERNIAGAAHITATATSLQSGLQQLIAHQLKLMLAEPEIYRIWLREMKAADGFGDPRARDALRRFSAQFATFIERWQPAANGVQHLDRSVMRDLFYGGIEQVGWTAVVQGRKRIPDIEDKALALAKAYLAAFGFTTHQAPRTKTDVTPMAAKARSTKKRVRPANT